MKTLRTTAPATCLLCGSALEPGLPPGPASNLRGHGTRRCRSCSFEVIDPMPSVGDLAALYGHDYWLHDLAFVDPSRETGRAKGAAMRAARTAVMAAHRVRFGPSVTGRRPRRGGHVLEVGFGAGVALERLSHRGWQVHGLEIADGPVRAATKRIPSGGFSVGTIETTSFPPESFELILLYHVLEHLADPLESLIRLSGWLEPGGTIVVAVPNRSSLTRRLTGSLWYGYRMPEHLAMYDPRTLTSAFRLAGLRVVAQRPQAYFHAFADSLLNRIDPGGQAVRVRLAVNEDFQRAAGR